MKYRVNERENRIQEYYESLGYEVYRRGWPDFCFVKDDDIQFIEVKRKNQNNIKPEQQRMRDLFSTLGLKYKVAFEFNDDGTPNFKDYRDEHPRRDRCTKKAKKLTDRGFNGLGSVHR